ncbi:MAG: 4a-hydroxytetrahydrobiopterin dehydratase [Chloroflexi bacterium]|nr:4a-hydroxytetrahydrobiopterin dehydratase [Chloroflexota bacterium]
MPYADPLTDAELAEALAALPEWSRDGDVIRRTARVAGFRDAVALVDRVADAAEAANHHPDIAITGYRNVSFELTTHAAKALTRRDVDLATEIDRLIIGRP